MEEGPSAWAHATYSEDTARIVGCWLWSGLVPTIATMWGEKQQVEGLSLPLSL